MRIWALILSFRNAPPQGEYFETLSPNPPGISNKCAENRESARPPVSAPPGRIFGQMRRGSRTFARAVFIQLAANLTANARRTANPRPPPFSPCPLRIRPQVQGEPRIRARNFPLNRPPLPPERVGVRGNRESAPAAVPLVDGRRHRKNRCPDVLVRLRRGDFFSAGAGIFHEFEILVDIDEHCHGMAVVFHENRGVSVYHPMEKIPEMNYCVCRSDRIQIPIFDPGFFELPPGHPVLPYNRAISASRIQPNPCQ